MKRSAMIGVALLGLLAAGCGSSSSSSHYSACSYDGWCDSWGCHEVESCDFESCTETWDDDYDEHEYREECRRGRRQTAERRSHDGDHFFRAVTEDGESCLWVQRSDHHDYDEYFDCYEYYDEETWRTDCDAGYCLAEHCINGVCYLE